MAKREFGTLAHTYTTQNVAGWLISRKFDGMSALWDGGLTRGMLASSVPWYYKGADKPGLTSTGLWTLGRGEKPKVVNAPDWWLNFLPVGLPLHGELWKGDNRQQVTSICRQGLSGRTDGRWKEVKYVVYNVKPYSCWNGIEQVIDEEWKKEYAKFVPNRQHRHRLRDAEDFMEIEGLLMGGVLLLASQSQVSDSGVINQWKHTVAIQGWEGFCLTNPASKYDCCRSHNLLKWKPEFETEGKVVGYEDGKTGKNIGKVGAVFCSLVWDEKVLSYTGGRRYFIGKEVIFKVSGWTDSEREWSFMRERYPIGSELHFSFKDVSQDGVPRSATVKRG